jgi:predicted enzyme related to lactoylglutathione lyase
VYLVPAGLYDRPMLRLRYIRFACGDPAAVAAFWAALLGYETTQDGERVLAADPRGEGPALAFDRLEKSPTIELPIHLDVNVPDREAEVRRARELGALIVETKTSTYGNVSETFTVMRDPEGTGFCIQAPDPRNPHAYVGNVTFSCAEPRRVLGPFWSQALGWPEHAVPPDFLQELRDAGVDVDRELYAFYAILRRDGRRPRLLFQRRERSRPDVYPIQLELASDDRTGDVERLERAGVTVVSHDHLGTLLHDPEGNPFSLA